MHDELGTRMKENFEHRTRYFLPRRTYTIARIDGKAFHTYTRGCAKPFDFDLMDDMAETAKYLCENIQGAVLAYAQSDEITIVMTDFAKTTTSAWFDGNIQKIVSVSASLATAKFNLLRVQRDLDLFRFDEHGRRMTGQDVNALHLAHFDSRCFTIPDPVEVENNLIWRNQDCTRNSIQMVARALASHKECNDLNQSELQELIHSRGQNWNDYPTRAKRGTVIRKEEYLVEISRDDFKGEKEYAPRTRWIIDKEPPVFTQDRSYLRRIIPVYDGFTWESS